jgi:hypothetical protein
VNPGEPDGLRLKSLLVPAPDDILVLSPASSLVNSVNNDGPELLVPTNYPGAVELILKSSIHTHGSWSRSNLNVAGARKFLEEFLYFPDLVSTPRSTRYLSGPLGP